MKFCVYVCAVCVLCVYEHCAATSSPNVTLEEWADGLCAITIIMCALHFYPQAKEKFSILLHFSRWLVLIITVIVNCDCP